MGATKEKIKVTVRREEAKELEISFPYYTRNKGLYCKFLSKDEAIWVCDYGFDRSVEWLNGAVPESWITFEPITESEFNEQFNEVMTALIDINNEKDNFIDSRSANADEYTKGFRDGWRDYCKWQKEFD